jgi:polyferredoxin
MYTFLRRFRIIFGMLFLIAFTLIFVDIGGKTASLFQELLKWQLTPAVLGVAAGSLGVLVFLLLITFVFGRVYCSFLCPAGIFQDVVITIANLFKSKKNRRYHYAKPHRWLRYGIMIVTIALLLLGSTALLLLFDPYSNYGRMAGNVFRPAVIALNNAGASLFSTTFYHVSYHTLTIGSIVAGSVFLVAITVMSVLRGRLYCNAICPVGSFLGFISRYSLFRIKINGSTCTHCRLCELACKAQCVDAKNEKVDHSRCVQCYNCTVACKQQSMTYRFAYGKAPSQAPAVPADPARRRVFITSAGLLGTAAIAHFFLPGLRAKATNAKAIVPPGAKGIKHLKQHCTACHACIAECPSKVIRPALGEYGLDGMMLPVMDYSHAFCNYECTECSNVCPNGALEPLRVEEKIKVQIGKAHFRSGLCIVVTDETDCGACDEHCPTKAVHMVPFRDGLLIPEVNTSLCIGCGGCEYICPGRHGKAIFVVANEEHQIAELPQNEKQEERNVMDFGF